MDQSMFTEFLRVRRKSSRTLPRVAEPSRFMETGRWKGILDKVLDVVCLRLVKNRRPWITLEFKIMLQALVLTFLRSSYYPLYCARMKFTIPYLNLWLRRFNG